MGKNYSKEHSYRGTFYMPYAHHVSKCSESTSVPSTMLRMSNGGSIQYSLLWHFCPLLVNREIKYTLKKRPFYASYSAVNTENKEVSIALEFPNSLRLIFIISS